MSGFSEEGIGQYIVLKNVVWDPHKHAGHVALFDEDGNAYLPAAAPSSGPTTLMELSDVTGTPAPGLAPVADHTGTFPLTDVATQAYVDEQVSEALNRWANLGQKLSFVSDISVTPWEPSNPSVIMTPDGLVFGPYSDASSAGGSIRYHGLDGQPLSSVKNLAYYMRFRGMVPLTAGSEPYARIYTRDSDGNQHDAIFTPGSQEYSGLGAGPLQEWVATSGTWRYDSDDGSGGVPLSDIQAQFGDHVIIKIAVTLGFTAGAGLVGLMRWMQVNGNRYTFGS